jgi:hypothetical protein
MEVIKFLVILPPLPWLRTTLSFGVIGMGQV